MKVKDETFFTQVIEDKEEEKVEIQRRTAVKGLLIALAVGFLVWLTTSGWLWTIVKGIFMILGSLLAGLAALFSSTTSDQSLIAITTSTSSPAPTPTSAPPEIHLPYILQSGPMDIPSSCIEAGESCAMHPSVYNTYGVLFLQSVVDKRVFFLGLSPYARDKLASELVDDMNAHSSLLNVTAAAAATIEQDLKDIWYIVSYRSASLIPSVHGRTASAAARCSFGALDAALADQTRRALGMYNLALRIRTMLLQKAIAVGDSGGSGDDGTTVRSLRMQLKTEAGKRHRTASTRAEQWIDYTTTTPGDEGDNAMAMMYPISQALLLRDAGNEEAGAALAWWLALEEVERAVSVIRAQQGAMEADLAELNRKTNKNGSLCGGMGWPGWICREVIRVGSCRCVHDDMSREINAMKGGEEECQKRTALDPEIQEMMNKVDLKTGAMMEQLRIAVEKMFNVGKEWDGTL